jgi:hypothetical protein
VRVEMSLGQLLAAAAVVRGPLQKVFRDALGEVVTETVCAGTCSRCGAAVTRLATDPVTAWHDFSGRDRCRADPADGPHEVPVLREYQREVKAAPPVAVVQLLGERGGFPVVLYDVVLPAVPGTRWDHALEAPLDQVCSVTVRVAGP